MKATGIVRRIDDLGRVVVPKEIRRTLRIHEGDPLEIFTDTEGEIILKKYSPMGELGAFVGELCDAVFKTTKRSFIVSDRDVIIAASGSFAQDIVGAHISEDLKSLMEERTRYEYSENGKSLTAREDGSLAISLAYPIITQGDVSGCVLFVEDGKGVVLTDMEIKMAEMLALFLSTQLEA